MSKIDPVKIVFDEPVEVDVAGETRQFTELIFPRKMKGKDMLAQEKVDTPLKKSWALYASMSGVPIQLFEELDADQFEEVAKKTAPLMGKRGKRLMDKKIADEAGGLVH